MPLCSSPSGAASLIADEEKTLVGLITTGDLTRLMEQQQDVFGVAVSTVMSRSPKTTTPDELASAVVYHMEQAGIMAMPVLDHSRRVVGVVHLHDLMRAGAA